MREERKETGERRETGEREGGRGNGYQRDRTFSTYMSERERGWDTERAGERERARGRARV